jgi:hypothetical protein
MTLPHQEHNSLLATREFLKILLDPKQSPDVPEKYRLSAKSFLEHYPDKTKLDDLYKGETIEDMMGRVLEEGVENPNKVVNNNQTWETPGYKWKTEVEFISTEP